MAQERRHPIAVHFRKFEDGDVLALWDDGEGFGWVSSYQHVGQHSYASAELIIELAEATEDEYATLLRELESIGYDVTAVE
jgi:N-acetyl-anhydromuramyl-L-alanine amidase AmpD